MRSAGTFEPTDTAAVARDVTSALRSWQVQGGAASMWATCAADHVGPGPARWVLEYDADLALVSFEVWSQEQRVFGIDDWLG